MGAWGYKSFENDDALDWLSGLPDGGLAYVRRVLRSINESSRFIEAPAASAVIAAGEVVAGLFGSPSSSLPSDASSWVASQPSRDGKLAGEARTAVERVFADSELRDLWRPSPDFEEWKKTVEDLIARLGDQTRTR